MTPRSVTVFVPGRFGKHSQGAGEVPAAVTESMMPRESTSISYGIRSGPASFKAAERNIQSKARYPRLPDKRRQKGGRGSQPRQLPRTPPFCRAGNKCLPSVSRGTAQLGDVARRRWPHPSTMHATTIHARPQDHSVDRDEQPLRTSVSRELYTQYTKFCVLHKELSLDRLSLEPISRETVLHNTQNFVYYTKRFSREACRERVRSRGGGRHGE